MDWGFLSFLAEPWFVIPWYAIGVLGALAVGVDLRTKNTPLKQAMKWAWPIIVLFFSVIGLALYFGTARAPGISRMSEDEKERAHAEYEKNMFRRVNGAVIHCVAGDGLGIMSGMVIARALSMTFWQEFWFEYAVGFSFGWLIFQFKSMTMMTDSKGKALLMAFRAEFFSMLTVMAGMGAVMAYVTPLAITQQPKPLTFAFWGFGMLGLVVGYVLTFPMNWMMVKVGWKHGMGKKEDSRPVKTAPKKAALLTAMAVTGALALVLPAWLVEKRDATPVESAEGAQAAGTGGSGASGLQTLAQGVRADLLGASDDLRAGRHSKAAHAIDSALRGAMTGKAAAPSSPFAQAEKDLKAVRRALHDGDEDGAQKKLQSAAAALGRVQGEAAMPAAPERYQGVTVLDAHGAKIGEVASVHGGQVDLKLGGARDVWGFVDLSAGQRVSVPVDQLIFGPSQFVGRSLVVLPSPPR